MFYFISSLQKSPFFIILCIVSIGISSCTKDTDNLVIVPPPTPTSIESISPVSGHGDTEVTITGISFSTDIDAISVFFNDQEAVVNSVTDTEIEAIVPRGALSGTVRVVINGQNTIGPEFDYIVTPAMVSTLVRSTVIGDMDGTLAEASFRSIWGIVKDDNDIIYITDSSNGKIKSIDINTGIVSTLTGIAEAMDPSIDGTLEEATFNDPRGLVINSNGNIIVTDLLNNNIRSINLSEGTVTTIAGTGDFGLVNGAGSIAQFGFPFGVAEDGFGNIYITELSNSTIRRIGANNVTSTLTGTGIGGFMDGPPDVAQISFATGIVVDNDGSIVFADSSNHSIRRVTPEGVVTTIAGTGITGDVDGSRDIAQFDTPFGVDIDSEGNIIVIDMGNNKIRRITPDGEVSTLAGTGAEGSMDGVPTIATFDTIRDLVIDDNDVIYISSEDGIRIYTPSF